LAIFQTTSEIKIQGGKRTIVTNFNGEKLSMQEVKQAIKAYILEEFLPGENPAELTDSTPLITGGILDSLATLKLVVFLEERFHIKIQAHETMVDYLNTISDIAQLVSSKM
jgi:acyl carrier protein